MRKNLLFVTAMLSLCVAFVSCSKTDLYEEGAKEKDQIKTLEAKYQEAFVNAFGPIASNQKWGFDNAAATRGSQTNIDGDYEIPSAFDAFNPASNSKAKRNWVSAFLKAEAVTGTELASALHHNNYFLQHVAKSVTRGKSGSGTSDTHHQLDQLQAYNYNLGDWQDVANFEGGMNNKSMGVTSGVKKKVTKGTMLMVSMGTPNANQMSLPQFRWTGASDDDSNNSCSNYVVKKINGYYYIGMSYSNSLTDVKKDYDAWIFRLVPATEVPQFKERGRIMCEDLGGDMSKSDLDFNDVVFDATINLDGSIDIEVVAAGGILPIKVADTAITLGEMTETGVNEAAQKPQLITVTKEKAASKGWTTLLSIPVVVTGKDGVSYELKAEEGKAPGKFCTYIGLPWPDEYVSIDTAYPNFKPWVNVVRPQEWWADHYDNADYARFTDKDLENNK